MSWLAKIVGGGLSDPIDSVGKILDNLTTNDEERAAGAAIMARIKQEPALAQVALNKIEAAHRSIFVAGWRPFIGWISGLGLAAYFLPQFILGAWVWVRAVNHVLETVTIDAGNILSVIPPYPVDGSELLELVVAMLGLGLLRTVEKINGKAK